MKMSEFQVRLGELRASMVEAETAYRRAADNYGAFLKEHLGVEPRETATVEGLVGTIQRVQTMIQEETK